MSTCPGVRALNLVGVLSRRAWRLRHTAVVPAAAAAETTGEIATPVADRARPTMSGVAVRQQLDVRAVHAAALAKLEMLQSTDGNQP